MFGLLRILKDDILLGVAEARAHTTKSKQKGINVTRLESLDVFRALMMFLMIFVNDIPGLKNIPDWLLHAANDENRLGLADIVFPGFLFIMGMAVPYAVEIRRQREEPLWQILLHIMLRTLALLVMGVFIVNHDTIGKCLISQPWFGIGMVTAFFLVWNDYSKLKGYWSYILRVLGIAVLFWLAYEYKGIGGAKFSPQWWGILGLIGWSYLTCAVVVLFTRFNLLLAIVAASVTIALCILPDKGIIKQLNIHHLDFLFPGGGVHAAFAIIGMMTSVIVYHFNEKANFCKTLLPILVGLAVAALAGAYWAQHHWIISKISATPTWLFLCCSIFFALFIVIYWLVDVAGKKNWFKIIAPAGTLTLTCYMIPYLWYSIQTLTGWVYPKVLNSGWSGLTRSLVFSLLCIGIAWGLSQIKIRLKI